MATSCTSGSVAPIFISHGGGPCFFMEDRDWVAGVGKGSVPAQWFASLLETHYGGGAHISAIVVVSAHWEEGGAEASELGESRPRVGVYAVDGPNTMLYDYSGFPPHTYALKYPAPGDPALGARIAGLLDDAGFAPFLVADRGLDHGAFVPLLLVAPEADIPVVQVSLHASLDADLHLRMGAALAPLAADGVLLVGSGFANHGSQSLAEAKAFVAWMTATLSADLSPDDQRAALADWAAAAPAARRNHAREEHLLPLHVVAAAAGHAPARLIYDGPPWMNSFLASYQFDTP